MPATQSQRGGWGQRAGRVRNMQAPSHGHWACAPKLDSLVRGQRPLKEQVTRSHIATSWQGRMRASSNAKYSYFVGFVALPFYLRQLCLLLFEISATPIASISGTQKFAEIASFESLISLSLFADHGTNKRLQSYYTFHYLRLRSDGTSIF